MSHRPSHPPRNQKGAVLIWVAFFLLAMLMFIALGIDMAKLMTTRTQLQNAADAAALAGASAFRDAGGAAVVSLARTRAHQTAAQNAAFEAATTPVLVDTLNDVIVDTDSMTVRVITRREQSAGTGMVTQFLRVIGLWTLDMRAAATARAEAPLCNLVPLAVQAPLGQVFETGCVHEYVIKEAPPNGTTGGYGGIDFSLVTPPCPSDRCTGMGSGSNRFRCEVTYGWPCCFDSMACAPSEQGTMSGPTKQAIEARFAADTDQREGICYSEYRGNGSRVVNTPLTGPKQGSGAGCYMVYGYGSFFIKRIPGNGNQNFITAEFLGEPGGNGQTTEDFRIRLIR
jgi:hypothetical protein